ncbi:MAG: DUF3105 domain-containing protein [Anaerolineales bacterium]
MSKRTSVQPPKYDPSSPRVSRREQLRTERRRRSLTWNVIVLGTLIVFVLAIIGYVIINQRPGQLPGEQVIPVEGAAVYPDGQQIAYQHYPPSSGGHYAAPAPWGVSTTPVAEGNYLTNLARGGVVILYACPTACPDLEQQLAGLPGKLPPISRYNMIRLLVTPYNSHPLDTPIVALSWGHQLNLAQYDESLLKRWYQRFVDQGPDLQP